MWYYYYYMSNQAGYISNGAYATMSAALDAALKSSVHRKATLLYIEITEKQGGSLC